MKRVLGFTLAVVMGTFLVTACDKDDDEEGGGTRLNQQDRDFVMMASMSNFAEISAGEIAADRGEHEGVTEYGQMMVTEHTTASQRLKTMATALNLYAPDSLDAGHVALADSLMMLTGMQFDSVYINSQIRDHQLAITLFQNEANNGSHEDLREFAEDMLPHLQHHLHMADSLSTVLGAQ